MQTMVPLYGFGGGSAAAVRRAIPRNLLDNSDFTNLVAQAGIGGKHGEISYAADRWILTSGTVSYEAGTGLTLNGTITQKLERIPNTVTPAVGVTSGGASISCADGTVTITSGGGLLEWAALYEGEYPPATLPVYRPKGYGMELAECQRYFVTMYGNFYLCSCGDGVDRLCITFPTMRARPAANYTVDTQVEGVEVYLEMGERNMLTFYALNTSGWKQVRDLQLVADL